jgi:hypothetical protein
MRGVGIEPTRIAPKDLKTFALTTRPSSLCAQRNQLFERCAETLMRAAGLEPARLSPTDLETVSLTTRTNTRMRVCNLTCIYKLGQTR